MLKTRSGFTLVELLIVIVVIGILAAITLVAYNGVQSQATRSAYVADIANIQKALELYKVSNGAYPPHTGTRSAICSTHTNGYSYSDATDSTWLTLLVTSGTISTVPVPSENDCNVYYSYLYVTPASYGCTGKRATNYYILQVHGSAGLGTPPSNAVNGTYLPCSGATASWTTASTNWVFEKDDT